MKITEAVLRQTIRRAIKEQHTQKIMRLTEGPKVKKFQELIGMEKATGDWGADGTNKAWKDWLGAQTVNIEGLDIEKIGADWQANSGNYAPNLEGMTEFVQDMKAGAEADVAAKLKVEVDEAKQGKQKRINLVKNYLRNLSETPADGVLYASGIAKGGEYNPDLFVVTSSEKQIADDKYNRDGGFEVYGAVEDKFKLRVILEVKPQGAKSFPGTAFSMMLEPTTKFTDLFVSVIRGKNQDNIELGPQYKQKGTLKQFLGLGDGVILEIEGAKQDLNISGKGIAYIAKKYYSKYVPQDVWNKFGAAVSDKLAKLDDQAIDDYFSV